MTIPPPNFYRSSTQRHIRKTVPNRQNFRAARGKVPLSGWAQMVAFAGSVELFQYVTWRQELTVSRPGAEKKCRFDGREILGYFNKKSRLLKYYLILIEFWPDGWSVGVGATLEWFLLHRFLDWKWVRFVYKLFVWNGDMKSVIGELGQGPLWFLAAPLIWYMDSWYLLDKEQTQDSLFLVIHMTLQWFITVGPRFPPNPWHFHPIHSPVR